MNVYGDIETYSQCSLKEHGAHIYATDPSTDVYFLGFTVGDGDIQIWMRGDPVPEPYANFTSYGPFVWDGWPFDPLIYTNILVKRYGFPPIPLENQDCAQRLALANAYPAELGLRCEALGLPYRKDPEARRAMLRLSRPQTAKKRKKPEDPAARARDLELLRGRCMDDVRATRAAYHSPRLRPLLPEERAQLLLDAQINDRGVQANIPFLEAVRTLAVQERNAINVRLNELSAGVITSVDQVKEIKNAINARGHAMTTLNKRSVSATLAHESDAYVRELLTLRQRGPMPACAPPNGCSRMPIRSTAASAAGGASMAEPPDGGLAPARSCTISGATTRSTRPAWSTRSLPATMPSSPAGAIHSRSQRSSPARHCAPSQGTCSCAWTSVRLRAGSTPGSPAKPGSSTSIGTMTPPATSRASPIA